MYTNFVVIGWYYFITLTVIYSLFAFSANKSAMVIAQYLVYTGGFELLGRMSKCSPYIPYEVGKYSFFVLSIIGVLLSFKQSSRLALGASILFLLIPSFFIDLSGRVIFLEIVFNVIGLVNVALGIIFFSALNISFINFIRWLRLLLLPFIAVLTYVYIKTPDLAEIEFGLGAIAETTGGFGSNQVSTLFGLGFMLMAISWIGNLRLLKYRWLDGILSIGFLIQGLLSFSRGGIIGGALGILIFMYYIYKISPAERYHLRIPNLKRNILPIVIAGALAFLWADTVTKGILSLRYRGETAATLRGLRESDLNTATSGRVGIFEEDIKLWTVYPLLGVGVGSSKYMREGSTDIAAHSELSRILAEHGFPGIIIIVIIGWVIYSVARKKRPYFVKAYIMALIAIAVVSSFHSATRTFVTPLLLSLGCVNIIFYRPSQSVVTPSIENEKL